MRLSTIVLLLIAPLAASVTTVHAAAGTPIPADTIPFRHIFDIWILLGLVGSGLVLLGMAAWRIRKKDFRFRTFAGLVSGVLLIAAAWLILQLRILIF